MSSTSPKHVSVMITDDPIREAADADVVVCVRCEDMSSRPAKAAQVKTCSKCKKEVWFAPNSPTEPPIMCVPCWNGYAEGEDDIICMMTKDMARKAGIFDD